MKLKFPRLDFKTSVLLVAGTSIVSYLTRYVLSIFSAASLEQQLIATAPLSPIYGQPVSMLFSFVFALTAVLFWWIGVVITDWASVKYFKAKRNYDFLASAFAVSFAITSIADFFISIFTILPSFISTIIGFAVYVFAVKEVYKKDWVGSILIRISVMLFMGLLLIASAVVGGIIGYVLFAGLGTALVGI